MNKLIYKVTLLFSIIFNSNNSIAQETKITVGAYYFDGWTGSYSYHLTDLLRTKFRNREPKWGWITSTQNIVNKQILEARKYNIDFFNFCWYYNGKERFLKEPLNRGLMYFKKATNREALKYSLLVVNHEGFTIAPKDWRFLIDYWGEEFKSNSYLKINNKPYISFFSISSLISEFSGAENVRNALIQLRKHCESIGLGKILIGVCVSPNIDEIKMAERCGFDILTGYNYASSGFNSSDSNEIPIDSLVVNETKYWQAIKNASKLGFIPSVTLNWDPRPWANKINRYSNSKRYVGFSENSVYKSMFNCRMWLTKNQSNPADYMVALLYAWNEYGEGAWLTPGKKGPNYLKSIKKALESKHAN